MKHLRVWALGLLLLGVAEAKEPVEYQDPQVGFKLPAGYVRNWIAGEKDELTTKQAMWNCQARPAELHFEMIHRALDPKLSQDFFARADVILREREYDSDAKFELQKKPVMVAGRKAQLVTGWAPYHIFTKRDALTDRIQNSDYWQAEVVRDYILTELDGTVLVLRFSYRVRDTPVGGKPDPAVVKEMYNEKIQPLLDSMVFFDAAHPAPNPEAQDPTPQMDDIQEIRPVPGKRHR